MCAKKFTSGISEAASRRSALRLPATDTPNLEAPLGLRTRETARAPGLTPEPDCENSTLTLNRERSAGEEPCFTYNGTSTSTIHSPSLKNGPATWVPEYLMVAPLQNGLLSGTVFTSVTETDGRSLPGTAKRYTR